MRLKRWSAPAYDRQVRGFYSLLLAHVQFEMGLNLVLQGYLLMTGLMKRAGKRRFNVVTESNTGSPSDRMRILNEAQSSSDSGFFSVDSDSGILLLVFSTLSGLWAMTQIFLLYELVNIKSVDRLLPPRMWSRFSTIFCIFRALEISTKVFPMVCVLALSPFGPFPWTIMVLLFGIWEYFLLGG